MPAFTQFSRGNPYGQAYEAGLARAQAEEVAAQQGMANRYNLETNMADRSALSQFVAEAPEQAQVQPPAGGAPMPQPASPAATVNAQRIGAIRRIAADNPLAGATTYKLYADEQGRQERVDKEAQGRQDKIADRVYDMLKSNTPDQISYARVMAQQNGITIPDEIFTNAQARARFVGMIETGKSMGYTPQQFSAYLAETNKRGSMTEDVQAGAAAAGKLPNKRDLRMGGGRSAREEYDQYRKKDLMKLGMTEEDAIRVIQLKGFVGTADRVRMSVNLMKATDQYGDPLYKTQKDALESVNAMVEMARRSDAAPQAPAAPAPGANTPSQPPVPDAKWSEKHGAWFVQKDGQWNRVD